MASRVRNNVSESGNGSAIGTIHSDKEKELFEKLVEEEMQRQLESIRRIAPDSLPLHLQPQRPTSTRNGVLSDFPNNYHSNQEDLRTNENENNASVLSENYFPANRNSNKNIKMENNLETKYPPPDVAYREALLLGKNHDSKAESSSGIVKIQELAKTNPPSPPFNSKNSFALADANAKVNVNGQSRSYLTSMNNNDNMLTMNNPDNQIHSVNFKNANIESTKTSKQATSIGFGRGLNVLHRAEDEDIILSRQKLLHKKLSYQRELDKQLEEKKQRQMMERVQENRELELMNLNLQSNSRNSSVFVNNAYSRSDYQNQYAGIPAEHFDVRSNNNLQHFPNASELNRGTNEIIHKTARRSEEHAARMSDTLTADQQQPVEMTNSPILTNLRGSITSVKSIPVGIPASSITRIGEAEKDAAIRRKLKQQEYARILEEQMRQKEEIKRKEKENTESNRHRNNSTGMHDLTNHDVGSNGYNQNKFTHTTTSAVTVPEVDPVPYNIDSPIVSPIMELEEHEKQQRRLKQEENKKMLSDQILEKKRREEYEKRLEEERERLDALRLQRQREEMRLAYERERGHVARNPNSASSSSNYGNHSLQLPHSSFNHDITNLEQDYHGTNFYPKEQNSMDLSGQIYPNDVTAQNIEADLQRKREEVYIMQQQQANLEQEIERQRMELLRLHQMNMFSPKRVTNQNSPVNTQNIRRDPRQSRGPGHSVNTPDIGQVRYETSRNTTPVARNSISQSQLANVKANHHHYGQEYRDNLTNIVHHPQHQGDFSTDMHVHGTNYQNPRVNSFHQPILAESPPLHKINPDHQPRQRLGVDRLSTLSSLGRSRNSRHRDTQLEHSMVSQSKLVHAYKNAKNQNEIVKDAAKKSFRPTSDETWYPHPSKSPTVDNMLVDTGEISMNMTNRKEREESLVEQSLPCASRYFIYVAEKTKANMQEPVHAHSPDEVIVNKKTSNHLHSRTHKNDINKHGFKSMEERPQQDSYNIRRSIYSSDEDFRDYGNEDDHNDDNNDQPNNDIHSKSNKKDKSRDEGSPGVPRTMSKFLRSTELPTDDGEDNLVSALTPMPRGFYNQETLRHHKPLYLSHLDDDGEDDLERSRVRTAQAARIALQRASAHSDDDDVVVAAVGDYQKNESDVESSPRKDSNNVNANKYSITKVKGEKPAHNSPSSITDFGKSGSLSSILTDIDIKNSQRSHTSMNSVGISDKMENTLDISGSANEENINRSNNDSKGSYSKLKGLKRQKDRNTNSVIEKKLKERDQRRFTVHTPNKDVYSSIRVSGDGRQVSGLNSSTISTKSRNKQKRKAKRSQSSARSATSVELDSDVDVDMDSLPSYFSEIDELDAVH